MEPMTLKQLTAAVKATLEASPGYRGVDNGQVRSMPDSRTIRYYRTKGLLDPPLGHRGRAALYGERHLLQLVAIKKLQARGLKLARIQEQLHGLTDEALEEVAGVPAESSPSEEDAERPELAHRRGGKFWSRPPAPVDMTASPQRGPERARKLPAPLQGLPVTEELTLLLRPGRELEESDWDAIMNAAQPLLEDLRQRGLLPHRPEDSQ